MSTEKTSPNPSASTATVTEPPAAPQAVAESDAPAAPPAKDKGGRNLLSDDGYLSDSEADDSRDAARSDKSGFFDKLKRIFTGEDGAPEYAADLDDGQRSAVARLPRARREMIERVIAFDQKRVDDVMAPRADIVAVDIDMSLDDLMRAFAEAGHSRLPIYRGDLDDPVGMVHIKDVVAAIAGDTHVRTAKGVLKELKRDLLYVPASMRITDLLLRMQASRIHMALVIDEYGGTDGLVTIEDLVEEVVGDINDEHDDEAEYLIVARPSGWDVDARVELEDFTEETGVDLDIDDEEVDTLGGLAVSIAGRVPQRGEVLTHPAGYEIEITDADPRMIRKIRIRHKGFVAAKKAAE